jgi:hypothetical protein
MDIDSSLFRDEIVLKGTHLFPSDLW